MNKVFLLLGSNLTDRLLMLNQAEGYIQKNIGEINTKSRIYESAPWGFEASTSFLNQTLIIETQLDPLEILLEIKQIEDLLGRVKTAENYESRTIDIDILFFNDEIIKLPQLIIPHPQIQNRKFTLVPLAEIALKFVHPEFKKTIQDLLLDCKDESIVKIYK
ncbi:MAG: 2-amino-4-hydroxy-6-hydroxymethyldihydropteridine diphosphokinase [Bacteroidetes bacterium GWF2_33_16]|nr:MAG: 2-amino-4-hydroxy-6-hydroxymethyldihydropteridine diphosphokinase [Bacteroidetes bacterium GWE2_32_14]OFY03685.1 MAG: 2-amino-4-hydroxy-6-hydroxymethyldihydropteridine diphosphokinase [Bacteroidetes bacterium GWF2_33_16]